MVVFIAHWCRHCQREVPRLVAWHHSNQTHEGLDVISVASGTDSSQSNHPPSSWLVCEEWPWPVMADSATSSAMASFGFSTFLTFVLIDADGIVRYRGSGEIEMVELDAILASTLGLQLAD